MSGLSWDVFVNVNEKDIFRVPFGWNAIIKYEPFNIHLPDVDSFFSQVLILTSAAEFLDRNLLNTNVCIPKYPEDWSWLHFTVAAHRLYLWHLCLTLTIDSCLVQHLIDDVFFWDVRRMREMCCALFDVYFWFLRMNNLCSVDATANLSIINCCHLVKCKTMRWIAFRLCKHGGCESKAVTLESCTLSVLRYWSVLLSAAQLTF